MLEGLVATEAVIAGVLMIDHGFYDARRTFRQP
jgi:hypothetical protein